MYMYHSSIYMYMYMYHSSMYMYMYMYILYLVNPFIPFIVIIDVYLEVLVVLLYQRMTL